jgi:hypothetical protein
MEPVDLHVLVSPDWPAALLDRALASTAGAPCQVWLAPWLGEGEGASRAAAYRLGQAPYVAWLDADDELIPGGMAALVAALEARPDACGAYGGEERVYAGGRLERAMDERWDPIAQLCLASGQHNAVVMRRQAVLPWLGELSAFTPRSNRLLRGLVTASGPWVCVPVLAYRWYRDRPCSLGAAPTPALDRSITRRLAPLLCRLDR